MLVIDMKAMSNFSNLPDARKQELISYIEGPSTEKMQKPRYGGG